MTHQPSTVDVAGFASTRTASSSRHSGRRSDGCSAARCARCVSWPARPARRSPCRSSTPAPTSRSASSPATATPRTGAQLRHTTTGRRVARRSMARRHRNRAADRAPRPGSSANRTTHPRVPADTDDPVVMITLDTEARPAARSRTLWLSWFSSVTLGEWLGFAAPAIIGAITAHATAAVTIPSLLLAGARRRGVGLVSGARAPPRTAPAVVVPLGQPRPHAPPPWHGRSVSPPAPSAPIWAPGHPAFSSRSSGSAGWYC